MITDREQEILALIEENPLISQAELAERFGITRSSVAVHISNLIKKGVIAGKGYIVQQDPYCVVVGGLNMDIYGKPHAPLIFKDSNPGVVRTSAGGVGRNIAHNLALLGEDVRFITAFGEDSRATELTANCRDAGIDVSNSLTVAGGTTSVYLFITDDKGDMELAVNDMAIYRNITPKFLAGKLAFMNRAALCLADTNIEAESLEYLAANLSVPFFVDAVSVVKAKKLVNILEKIHTLKANRLEAELLTGIAPGGREATRAMGQVLLQKGVQQVYISLGSQGLYCASSETEAFLPVVDVPVANTTGAGDCLMATLAWGWRQGLDLVTAGKAGQIAASVCIQSASTVNTALNAVDVLRQMEAENVVPTH